MAVTLTDGATYECVIVGAGPSGLVLTATLLNQGIDPTSSKVLLLSKHDGPCPPGEARSTIINYKTLECIRDYIDDEDGEIQEEAYDPCSQSEPTPSKSATWQLLPHVLSESQPSHTFRSYSRAHFHVGPLFEVDMSIWKPQGQTRFANLRVWSQAFLERGLAKRIDALGGKIHWGWEVVGIEWATEPRKASTLRLQGKLSDGELISKTVYGHFIVAADGANSLVRRSANIPFEHVGRKGEDEQTFLMGHVRVEDPKWPFEVS